MHQLIHKDPLERMLDMKDEQIRELKNDLAKKDHEWMEKVEELRGQLGKRDDEVYKDV